MAGGTFDNVGEKVIPGNYINLKAQEQTALVTSTRGITVIPLANFDWGPKKTFISVDAAQPDKNFALIGRSIYDDNKSIRLIREALKGAKTVYAYIMSGGDKAKMTCGKLTITAKYGGTRGNDITVTVSANPAGGMDVLIHLDTKKIGEYEGIKDASELENVNNEYVDFTGSGELEATAGTKLSGGTTVASTNEEVSEFLDACERIKSQSIAFPFGDKTLKEMFKSKISYMRNRLGKTVVGVVSNFAADYEGIINDTNTVELESGELTVEEATAFVAGIQAGATESQTNTYRKYDGAIRVIGEKNNEEAEAALKKGEFFFIMSENDEVIVQSDVNSLVTFTKTKTKDYRKNKIIRVYDAFADALHENFPPARYNNTPEDWSLEEGLGRALLKEFENSRSAIKNVDYDNDFKVDTEKSVDDYTVFNIGLQAVDATEKFYFNITTR